MQICLLVITLVKAPLVGKVHCCPRSILRRPPAISATRPLVLPRRLRPSLKSRRLQPCPAGVAGPLRFPWDKCFNREDYLTRLSVGDRNIDRRWSRRMWERLMVVLRRREGAVFRSRPPVSTSLVQPFHSDCRYPVIGITAWRTLSFSMSTGLWSTASTCMHTLGRMRFVISVTIFTSRRCALRSA